jgi:hypothetical protein
MTLKELLADVKPYGIRKIGVFKRSNPQNGKVYVSVIFTTDEKVVFPHKLENMYALVLASDSDTQRVNMEQVKALKRALILDWDEE